MEKCAPERIVSDITYVTVSSAYDVDGDYPGIRAVRLFIIQRRFEMLFKLESQKHLLWYSNGSQAPSSHVYMSMPHFTQWEISLKAEVDQAQNPELGKKLKRYTHAHICVEFCMFLCV